MSKDILEDLVDLLVQATTEKSHYYVADCCQRAIDEIQRLRKGQPDPRLLAELKEADARAGKAERHLERLEESERRRNVWLLEAKQEAGYGQNVSFDVVWKDVLSAFLREKKAMGG